MTDRTYSLSQRTMREVAQALEGGRIAVADLHEIVERCEAPIYRRPRADAQTEMSDSEYQAQFEARFGSETITTGADDDYARSFAARFGGRASF